MAYGSVSLMAIGRILWVMRDRMKRARFPSRDATDPCRPLNRRGYQRALNKGRRRSTDPSADLSEIVIIGVTSRDYLPVRPAFP